MSCLKNIIRISVIVLAVIGFKALGGFEFVKNLHWFAKPSQEVLQERSKEIADFSKIPEEYEIDRTANILGYKAVLAEHKASGQKLAIIKPKKEVLLTKKDFANGNVKTKLNKLNDKLAYQYIRLENFKIIKQGNFKTMGQTVPYAKFEADVTNLPIKKIEGIIGVYEGVSEDKDKSSKILVSASEGGKYSQILTEQFFRQVR